MVLFRNNLPQPTQAQLMRGEFPETLCIEQGVVLSCRFAESKVRWTVSCALDGSRESVKCQGKSTE